MEKFYTGVGSRNTPADMLELMTKIAKTAGRKGYTLRSGGAAGADTAFENGSEGGMTSDIYFAEDCTQMSMDIAAKFHPAWHRCSIYAKRLHGRNSLQILGKTLAIPSKFLVCWTPDGCRSHAERTIKSGGTGTAISIADHYNVPIFNLQNQSDLEKCLRWIKS